MSLFPFIILLVAFSGDSLLLSTFAWKITETNGSIARWKRAWFHAENSRFYNLFRLRYAL